MAWWEKFILLIVYGIHIRWIKIEVRMKEVYLKYGLVRKIHYVVYDIHIRWIKIELRMKEVYLNRHPHYIFS